MRRVKCSFTKSDFFFVTGCTRTTGWTAIWSLLPWGWASCRAERPSQKSFIAGESSS